MATQKFPGLIDMHVHLRDPGQTHKEDFTSGSRAAIKGGFTFLADMPNNQVPIFSPELLEEKIQLAQKKSLIDIGFHFGTNGQNMASFHDAWKNPHVFGLKIYCNHTTGELLITDTARIEKVFQAWGCDKPILVHAEGEQLVDVIDLARIYKRRLHVCHITQQMEVTLVRSARSKGILVTSGVTPHHLFLSQKDVATLGAFAQMKPPVGTQEDCEALWEGIVDGTIDIVESDHAPHTREEKEGTTPPFGVPGLETTLGLLLRAVHEKRFTIETVLSLLYERPKKLFSVPEQDNTYIEFDPEKTYILGADGYETKCGWSPFDGWELYGKVKHVVLRGKEIFIGGKVQ